jgi:hypothetical protein
MLIFIEYFFENNETNLQLIIKNIVSNYKLKYLLNFF